MSASTITPIEQGDVDPTLGMATRTLAAAGLQIPARPEQLCDPEALHAARAILDGNTPVPADGTGMAGGARGPAATDNA